MRRRLIVLGVALTIAGIASGIWLSKGPSGPPTITLERARTLAAQDQISGAHFDESAKTLEVSGPAGEFMVAPYPSDPEALKDEFLHTYHMAVGGSSGGSSGVFGGRDMPGPLKILVWIIAFPLYGAFFVGPFLWLGVAVAATLDLKRLREMAGRAFSAADIMWIVLFFMLPVWGAIGYAAVARRPRLAEAKAASSPVDPPL